MAGIYDTSGWSEGQWQAVFGKDWRNIKRNQEVKDAEQRKLSGTKTPAEISYSKALASGNYETALPIDPATGRPLAVKWQSMLNPDGTLKDPYKLTDQMDTQALDQYKQEALRAPGTNSVWADLMLKDLDNKKMAALDDNNRMIAGQRSDQLSQLAQSGGLSSGARERAFRASGRDALMSKQKTLRDSMNDANNVLLQDENSRKDMLGQSVNMDASRASYLTGIQQTNAQNAGMEFNAGRDYQQNRYNKEMEAWGATKQAEAQKGGSCFAGETLIAMKDGSQKRIDQIEIGDETLLGGMVTQTIQTLKDWRGDLYDYKGTLVTGSHAVYEDKEFKRVKDSHGAKLSPLNLSKVYNLSTEKHIVLIGQTIFADYTETTKTSDWAESLKVLNDEFRQTLS